MHFLLHQHRPLLFRPKSLGRNPATLVSPSRHPKLPLPPSKFRIDQALCLQHHQIIKFVLCVLCRHHRTAPCTLLQSLLKVECDCRLSTIPSVQVDSQKRDLPSLSRLQPRSIAQRLRPLRSRLWNMCRKKQTTSYRYLKRSNHPHTLKAPFAYMNPMSISTLSLATLKLVNLM